MKSLRIPSFLAAAALLASPLAQAQLTINEVDADTPGTDTAEFVELYDGGTGNTALDGYVLVFFNGNGDVSYAAYDLDGYSTDGNGFFVVGNSGVGSAQITFTSNGLQNGADAVALYTGDAIDFPNGTAPTITGTLVDAIVYDTNDSDDTGLLAALGQTIQYNEDENGNKDTESNSRLPDGGSTIAAVTPTPGAANPVAGGALSLSLDTDSIPEDGTVTITGTVTVGAPVSGDLAVTVIISDGTEATAANATIFDTETEGTFTIDAVDDFWPDGDQVVTVTVTAPTYDDDDDTFTVTDDDTNFLLLINEVYYAADASLSDANGDGTDDTTAPSDDEFIEIVNTSGGPLDLSGVELITNFGGGPAHTFAEGTTLGAGCAIVVFSGGDIPDGSTASFGTTEVQKSNGGGLYLDDDGTEFIRVIDANGTLSGTADGELQALDLPDQTTSPADTGGSYALQTDATYASGYALHTLITATMGSPYSPGTMLDGTAFCILTDSITVSFINPDVSEAAGSVSPGGSVSVPAPVTADLTVYLSSSDTGELDAESANPVTISAGTNSADFDLYPVDDLDLDGPQTVTVTARASGYLNGDNTIDVTDDDTTVYTPPNLIITEIMYNPNTSEANEGGEWIEIYNADTVSVDLTGFHLEDEDAAWGAMPATTLDPGKYAVLMNSELGATPASFRTDWGVPVDALVIEVTWANLSNGPSSSNEILDLKDNFGNILDTVNFDDGVDWPSDSPDGPSIALITTAYDDVSNDSGTNWLRSDDAAQANAVSPTGTTFSTSDVGSPGFDGTGSAPTSDFTAWIDSFFPDETDTDIIGFDADPDLDGDSNAEEWYFFNTSPDSPSTNGAAIPAISPGATPGDFTFTHRRPLDRAGVIETYQWSTNLDGTWNPSDATVTITPGATTPDGAGYELVEVTVSVTPATTEKVFVRLELTEVP